MNQSYYNYEDIQNMKVHAKKYSEEFDKKSFLKNVSTLEQKIILMTSQNPYEVLNYLEQLNDEKTIIMLNELTPDEIKSLINLFSAKEKEAFYANFSQTSLVNKFIANDKYAFNHVDNLELDRKIELLDSSKEETKQASQSIYESISAKEKEEVKENLTTAEASVVVDEVSDSIDKDSNDTEKEQSEELNLNLNEKQQEIEKETQEIEQNQEEKENEQKEIQEIEQNQEEKEEQKDIQNIDLTTNLNEDLSEKKETVNLMEFQEAKSNCEQEIIKNAMQNQIEQEIINENSYVKTLQ